MLKLMLLQLSPENPHILGSFNSDTDLPAVKLKNLNHDIIADEDGVVAGVACENQHSLSSLLVIQRDRALAL